MDENFIPWEQIEPLLRSGMTFQELGEAVLAKMGLPHGKGHYVLETVKSRSGAAPLDLSAGLRVIKQSDTGGYRKSGSAVIA